MIDKRITVLLIPLAIILIQSCLSVARLSDFPKTARGYDFNNIVAAKNVSTDKGWNKKTGLEYYIKTNVTVDSLIIRAITGAIESGGFTIEFLDKNTYAIIGKRGLRANEWKSVIGVYYKINNDVCEMYVKCKITQDFTGGWRTDRAKKVGEIICRLPKSCDQSYTVDPSL